MKRFMLAGVASLVMMAGVAQANDQQLYDPAPPADAAFVRVVNGTANAVDVTVGSAAYAKVAKGAAATYQIVKEGEYKPSVVVAGKTSEEAGLKVTEEEFFLHKKKMFCPLFISKNIPPMSAKPNWDRS